MSKRKAPILKDMNEPLFAPRTGPYLGYRKENHVR